ncbi:MAG: VTT domain-containing protein [Terriglobales bacterium]
MNHFLATLAHHGYSLLFVVVLAEAVGLPVPAALALVAAGAGSAAGVLNPLAALAVALVAMLLGDSVLFFLGRYTGWALLAFLCRVSANPETCILRSAGSFYKRGKLTLVIAKFVPGLNTMAPPLAGSMKMRPQQFLRFDFAGVLLYVVAYGGLGFVFRNFLASITRGFETAGHVMVVVIVIAMVAYLIYRIRIFQRSKIYSVVPRVQVGDLALKLQSEEKDNIVLADVRSHGYYDADSARIKGSIRIEPNNLAAEIETLPKDKDIYVYCT